MITEDYIGFEVAKLLKQKGFDVKCEYCYAEFSNDDIEVIGLSPAKCAQSLKEDRYPYITLQMVMKWLREVHGIILVIAPNLNENYDVIDGYCCMIYKEKRLVTTICDDVYTYKQAGEEGIKYAHENLI